MNRYVLKIIVQIIVRKKKQVIMTLVSNIFSMIILDPDPVSIFFLDPDPVSAPDPKAKKRVGL